MSKIIVQGNTVLLCSETSFLHHFIGAAESKLINISQTPVPVANESEKEKLPNTTNGASRGKDEGKDIKINFICTALSSDNQLLAVQSLEKILLVYNIHDWKLIHQKQLGRGASKIIFTPDNKYIVVGDKTGDVFLYKLYSDEKETLLLGHLSIILDIVMTDDCKYIITCDRDEKIRVSKYPNCYNIESYCLGHEQFVTNIQLLPHNHKMLISCSGDGTLKLWDYIKGSIKDFYNFNADKAESNAVSSESQYQLKCFTSVQLNEKNSIVCVSIFNSNKIQVLKINDECFEMVNTINLVHEPIHLQLSPYTPECSNGTGKDKAEREIHLWLMELDEVQVFTWDNCHMLFEPTTSPSILNSLNILNSNFKNLAVDYKSENVIYVLQKRKMDEISDYFARKKARMDEKKSQSK